MTPFAGTEPPQQPAVKVRLHSAGAASLLHPNAAAALGTPGLAALLLPQIFPIFSVVAPCQAGASPPSVRRRTCTTGCLRAGVDSRASRRLTVRGDEHPTTDGNRPTIETRH